MRGLAKHYLNAPGFPGRQHHVTQTQYNLQADGSVKMRGFAFVTECEGEPPYVLRFTGWYEDHAVKGATASGASGAHGPPVGRRRAGEVPRRGRMGAEQAPGVTGDQALIITGP